MKIALVGYTGFVGQNLTRSHQFTNFYNSKNIDEINGEEFDLVVCSAIPAAMWLANQSPQEDKKQIENLLSHLSTVKTNAFVHISTVAVYPNISLVHEDSYIDESEGLPYGKNRYFAEKGVLRLFDNVHILRLPALYGYGLKKNFIYDMLHLEPQFLTESIFSRLKDSLSENQKSHFSKLYVFSDEKKGYALNSEFSKSENAISKEIMKLLNFSSMNFTHSNSEFQFYDLENLWNDIQKVLEYNIPLINLTSEPLSSKELAKEVLDIDLTNEEGKCLKYNIQSKYDSLWTGQQGYLYSKENVLKGIKKFFNENQRGKKVAVSSI